MTLDGHGHLFRKSHSPSLTLENVAFPLRRSIIRRPPAAEATQETRERKRGIVRGGLKSGHGSERISFPPREGLGKSAARCPFFHPFINQRTSNTQRPFPSPSSICRSDSSHSQIQKGFSVIPPVDIDCRGARCSVELGAASFQMQPSAAV